MLSQLPESVTVGKGLKCYRCWHQLYNAVPNDEGSHHCHARSVRMHKAAQIYSTSTLFQKDARIPANILQDCAETLKLQTAVLASTHTCESARREWRKHQWCHVKNAWSAEASIGEGYLL